MQGTLGDIALANRLAPELLERVPDPDPPGQVGDAGVRHPAVGTPGPGALQNFFTWLCRENTLTANPAADLDLPRKPAKSLPRSLTQEEVHAVLNMPDCADCEGVS